MNFFGLFAFALVVLAAILSTASADYHHKKPLKIKHTWKSGGHKGKGYGGGHGYGHGKKLTGHSKRYQHQKHGKGHY